MAKKGVKVKELARELGITSHAIVERCRAEGIFVQNSITRLTPKAQAAVRAWFASGGADAAKDPSRTGPDAGTCR